MTKMYSIQTIKDIPISYQNTPIGDLLAFHNFDAPQEEYQNAQILIGMCIDHRAQLYIPQNFAYVLRSPGANFDQDSFAISYAVAVGGVRHIALIGHTNCGMVNLKAKKENYIIGLVSAGWEAERANRMFKKNLKDYEINNEIEILVRQTKEFREKFTNCIVVPMMYRVENRKLYLLK